MRFRIAIFLVLLLLYGCGESGTSSSPGINKWTVMVFMNDTSVVSRELAGIDLYEMRRIGSTDYVRIIVQRSSDSGQGMVRYLVRKGSLDLLEVLPEADPGSPASLLSFVNWCIENHSAEKYMLVLWEREHSKIWDGLVEWIDMVKIFPSFNSKIDLLVLDSSAKAELELLNEVKASVSVAVALQGVMPEDGFDYESILGRIVGNPGCGSSEASSYFIENFRSLYSKRNDVAISVISLAKIPDVLTYLDRLGGYLLNFEDTLALWWAIIRTQSYFISSGEEPSFKDLYDFCEKVMGLEIEGSAKETINSLKKAIKDAVLSEWHPSDSLFSLANGISIYISSLENVEDVYKGFAIANDVPNWYEFLRNRLGR